MVIGLAMHIGCALWDPQSKGMQIRQTLPLSTLQKINYSNDQSLCISWVNWLVPCKCLLLFQLPFFFQIYARWTNQQNIVETWTLLKIMNHVVFVVIRTAVMKKDSQNQANITLTTTILSKNIIGKNEASMKSKIPKCLVFWYP